MKIQLQKLGRIRGTESPDEIRAAFNAMREENASGAEAHQHRQKEDLQRAIIDGLKRRLRANGIDPANMTQAELEQRADELTRATIEREEAAKQKQTRERLRQREADLFRKACCPERHALRLGAIDEGRHVQWIATRNLLVSQANYANGFLVALLGGRGSGKTKLSVSAIRQCCAKQMTCRYSKALDLFRDLRRGFTPVARGQAGESEADIVDGWAKYDLLVIDECHQRGETMFEQNALVNLLDRRYDARKCTILIANLTKEQFAESMGDSIVSRIHETGEAIVCKWPSFRKEGTWRQQTDAPRRIPSGALRQNREDQ